MEGVRGVEKFFPLPRIEQGAGGPDLIPGGVQNKGGGGGGGRGSLGH